MTELINTLICPQCLAELGRVADASWRMQANYCGFCATMCDVYVVSFMPDREVRVVLLKEQVLVRGDGFPGPQLGAFYPAGPGEIHRQQRLRKALEEMLAGEQDKHITLTDLLYKAVSFFNDSAPSGY